MDDLICLTTSVALKERLFKAIADAFDFEDKGELKNFLGMKVSRNRSQKRTTLDMVAYIIQGQVEGFQHY